VSTFLRQAEEILEVAAGGAGAREVAILLGAPGGIRMMDPAGWSLAGLSAEFGATAVYRVERRGETLRVEGLSGSERCLLQREAPTWLRHPAPPFATSYAAGPAAISGLR
jgi:hypothetical protein